MSFREGDRVYFPGCPHDTGIVHTHEMKDKTHYLVIWDNDQRDDTIDEHGRLEKLHDKEKRGANHPRSFPRYVHKVGRKRAAQEGKAHA